ncbi:lipid-A-disaccharide kinase [Malonomonas rubra DSM 5091]|uniref:Tetraacyldisaccharide 4'-kinase n=1 Tax=Malonomonas rubra DSM 5091 TaxID=1122189 RepID=A0A1M6C870_MALRU|nr:tetraacyldisaccharide 4'-kinase [Malonomonas rubra]SHI57210.1 lipid-A-disaccharide kinase [Malonomonas rubra DSM 5091]
MKTLLAFHRRIATYGAKSISERVLFFLLLPAAWLYGVIGLLRNLCYDLGILSSYRASVPVISVGNLAAGGTGKTPVVDWLVKEFIALGKSPAVVSRGYGGSFAGKVGIVSLSGEIRLTAKEAGDEPVLLARRNPQANVFISRCRADGVQEAINAGADVIILDDGFQHRAVQRDVDLVLLDATNPYGNEWPLPAGFLREFPVVLKRADLLLLTRSSGNEISPFAGKKVFHSQHSLAEMAVSLDGEEVALKTMRQKKLFAFAGIANPESFFAGLENAGIPIIDTLALGDHCDFDCETIAKIHTAAKNCDALLTTEKDAVKLAAEDFPLPCYQVPLSLAFSAEEEFKSEIFNKVME